MPCDVFLKKIHVATAAKRYISPLQAIPAIVIATTTTTMFFSLGWLG